jgi:hypothetical protein
MPTLLDDGPAVIEGAVDAPEGCAPATAALQALGIVEVVAARFPDAIGFTPPPSKVDIEPALPIPDVPTPTVDIEPAPTEPDVPAPAADIAVWELGIAMDGHAATPVAPSVIGLRPPGLSSTEPIGIPVGPTEPRGEVAPIAGNAGAPTCASPGLLSRSAASVMAIGTHVVANLYALGMGAHRSSFQNDAGHALDECPGVSRAFHRVPRASANDGQLS